RRADQVVGSQAPGDREKSARQGNQQPRDDLCAQGSSHQHPDHHQTQAAVGPPALARQVGSSQDHPHAAEDQGNGGGDMPNQVRQRRFFRQAPHGLRGLFVGGGNGGNERGEFRRQNPH